ncbi:hypothetical protein D3C81_1503960 [compost metagenome]
MRKGHSLQLLQARVSQTIRRAGMSRRLKIPGELAQLFQDIPCTVMLRFQIGNRALQFFEHFRFAACIPVEHLRKYLGLLFVTVRQQLTPQLAEQSGHLQQVRIYFTVNARDLRHVFLNFRELLP